MMAGIPLKLSRRGVLLASIFTLSFLACSGSEATVTPAPTATSPAEPTTTVGPAGSTMLSLGVISMDLSVGTNRVAFFLLDSDSNHVRVDEIDVSTFYPADDTGKNADQVGKARFRQWPLGGVGVYTTQVDFHTPGVWRLGVDLTSPDGSVRSGQGVFQVQEKGVTPSIGSPAPASHNRTARDVGKLEELTSARPPDPELYSMTIAEALATGKPLVVVFATPAFCQTSTCGPQVDVVKAIKDSYRDKANFIHVEIFDNPQEVQGDLNVARVAEAVEEWKLPTEPWTFVVDREGRIAAKFEAFTTSEEIEEALIKVLQ